MRCCDELDRAVTLCTGDDELSLLRCRSCDTTHWERSGTPVSREQAFAHLAHAYRGVPLQARAARDRAATASAARQAARLAAQARAQARTRAQEAPCGLPTRGLSAATDLDGAARGTAPEDLGALLAGWTVLGATG